MLSRSGGSLVGMTHDILVLGGTGKTGRRISALLADAGANVRVAARNPGPELPGTRSVEFDWFDDTSHDAALDGADAVYVIPPALVVDHVAMSTALFARAAALGVQRVVLLSARGVDADDTIPLRRAELALLDTPGLDATVIRPSWFAQNFTEGVFAGGVADGVLAAPAGDGREPFIDADDIAAVAATLLLDHTGAHRGEALDLSGSVAYTFAEAADVVSARVGHPVRYVDLAPDDFVAGAVAAGLPADYAGLLASLFEVIRNGWDAHVSDGVERVLGRPARSLAEWAADATAASGAPS
jgi:uncharacterized protein YbjT (DUF2867 family)